MAHLYYPTGFQVSGLLAARNNIAACQTAMADVVARARGRAIALPPIRGGFLPAVTKEARTQVLASWEAFKAKRAEAIASARAVQESRAVARDRYIARTFVRATPAAPSPEAAKERAAREAGRSASFFPPPAAHPRLLAKDEPSV